MAFVVTQACYGCKYTDCVLVCPVDAFREGEQMLYIDPDCCIAEMSKRLRTMPRCKPSCSR